MLDAPFRLAKVDTLQPVAFEAQPHERVELGNPFNA